ncbi:glyoxylase-like metal-dependent hydrolase (beta-lactamase superfamily II) [Shimia isoporae]|uniref:Glyoxylase-like metal-dependent hydrolase (Beta-lactamase superfamily II) n=1 Tax=Shimia isoporae TaxID=647720 RepID=A0A4R1NS30_9RHOB|nr:MBL fold metallo-hydrolase [Shimia isoporae]TCL09573.1 glyoxylase-like metal-dependent hydrolase (beta-lactamase superfamily II) [Shimia isoporae]
MSMNRRTFLSTAAAVPALAIVPTGLLASGPASEAMPATFRFKVGNATVTALLDGYLDAAPQLLSEFDEANVTKSLSAAQQELMPNGIRIPVNAFLIEQGETKTLVDAGTAGLMGDTLGNVGSTLAHIGVNADQIDLIALTHMHPDHSGGIIDGSGAAVFKNAQVAVSQAEFDFWHNDAIMAATPESARGFFQIARNTVAPYADQLLLHSDEQDVADGLMTMPLPGHTPGHAGYVLQSGEEQLLFWGDLIHMTALQFSNPELTIAFDADPATTVETRQRMLDRAASDNLWVTGSHLDFPGLGRVRKTADGFGYHATPWQYGA